MLIEINHKFIFYDKILRFIKASEFDNTRATEEAETQGRLELRKIVHDEFRKRRIGGSSTSFNDSPNFSVPTVKRSRESSSKCQMNKLYIFTLFILDAYPYLLHTDTASSNRGCLVTFQVFL